MEIKTKIIFLFLFNSFYCFYQYRFPSEEIINFLIKKEGFNKSVYLDKANVPTIGYGFSVKVQKIIGKRIDSFDTLSENQSREILSFLLLNKF